MGCDRISESEASVRIDAFLEERSDCDGGFPVLSSCWIRVHMEHRDVVYETCLHGANLFSAIQGTRRYGDLGDFLLSCKFGLRNKDVWLRLRNSRVHDTFLDWIEKEGGVSTPNLVMLYSSGFTKPLIAT